MEKALAKIIADKEFSTRKILVWILAVILVIFLTTTIAKKDVLSIVISIINLGLIIIIAIIIHKEKQGRTKELEERIRKAKRKK